MCTGLNNMFMLYFVVSFSLVCTHQWSQTQITNEVHAFAAVTCGSQVFFAGPTNDSSVLTYRRIFISSLLPQWGTRCPWLPGQYNAVQCCDLHNRRLQCRDSNLVNSDQIRRFTARTRTSLSVARGDFAYAATSTHGKSYIDELTRSLLRRWPSPGEC